MIVLGGTLGASIGSQRGARRPAALQVRPVGNSFASPCVLNAQRYVPDGR